MAKPLKQENYDEDMIYWLEKQGRLIITRKRNGWKLYAVKAEDGAWRIYTDGCREVHSVDHIKDALTRYHPDIPSKTILVGEGVVPSMCDFDKLERVQSILTSKKEAALKKQEGYGNTLKIRFFEIAVWNGKPICAEVDYGSSRLPLLRYIFGENSMWSDMFGVVEQVIGLTYDQAKKKMVAEKWEGLVLYDDHFRNSFRLDGGDPERVRGCYKKKPKYEDDFIVRHPIMDPKDPKRVKEVALSQLNGTLDRNEFDCGVFGAFSKKERDALLKAKYPRVIQLEFDHRFESGKLQAARFVRWRYDKNIRDCKAPRKYPIE